MHILGLGEWRCLVLCFYCCSEASDRRNVALCFLNFSRSFVMWGVLLTINCGEVEGRLGRDQTRK